MSAYRYYPPQRSPRYSRGVEIAKFWSRVDTSGECWLWTAGKGSRGTRGFMSWRGLKTLAYRISWELEHGSPPPAEMHVCHHCDNGLCVRPQHLFLGRDLENVRDMWSKGRAVPPPHPRGESHPQVRHSNDFVRGARELVAVNKLVPLASIAGQIGVSHGTLRTWVLGHTRRDAGGPVSDDTASGNAGKPSREMRRLA